MKKVIRIKKFDVEAEAKKIFKSDETYHTVDSLEVLDYLLFKSGEECEFRRSSDGKPVKAICLKDCRQAGLDIR